MCSPQSSNMDDVNRLLHPVHQACAVVLQDTQEFNSFARKTKQYRRDSRCQPSELVSREHPAVPLVTVAESNESQTN